MTAHHEDSRRRSTPEESHDYRSTWFCFSGGAIMSDTMVSTVRFGVGIDTARYGHYATFLREDREKAARGFTFMESREGYEQFQAALARLAERHGGNVHFHIRLDAAGQYAVNLETFLRRLPFSTTISI